MKSRTLRTTLRTLHILAFGAYYGGQLYSVSAERLEPALAAVVGTGVLFMLFEISRAPVWLHQLRGVFTYGKIGLLISAMLFPDYTIALLTLIVILGVIVSHAPSSFRYYSVLRRQVLSTHGKG